MKWIDKLIKRFSTKGSGKENSIIVNGISANGSIYIDNGKVVVDGNVVNTFDQAAPVYILIKGDVNADIKAKGSVLVEGSINGKVSAGTSLSCENIDGNITAGTSVVCNDVKGNITASTSIKARDVTGNMKAGTSIKVSTSN